MFLGYYRHNGLGQPGWTWKRSFGPGAGYVGGSTLYVAWRSASRRWQMDFRGKRLGVFGLEVGWTRNWNAVPYATY